MKKTVMTLLAGAVVALSTVGFAPEASAQALKVGVVNTQEVLKKSSLLKDLQVAEQSLVSAEQQLIKLRNDKLKELEAARKKVEDKQMTEEAFVKLKRKFEDELRQKITSEQSKLDRKRQELTKKKGELEKKVQAIVQKVAKQKGLTIVINKNLVLFGGTDITQDVVKELG